MLNKLLLFTMEPEECYSAPNYKGAPPYHGTEIFTRQ